MIEPIVALLRYAAPVGIAALGETVGQRAGVLNIGLEGMMITSAYVAVVVTQSTGSCWLGLLAGVVSAVALALLQALFTIKLAADQVVVGTAINLFGLGLTSTLYRLRFGSSGQLLSVPKFPRFGDGLDLVLIGWLLVVGVVTWMLFRSNWGLVVRATGEYPPATVASGFSPAKLRLQAVLIGGVLAGVAGAYLSLGIAGSFAENMTAGRGFVALAMVTFGRWKPIWVLGASLLIGYADTLQYELQAKGIALPPQALLAFPYLLALVVLVVIGKGTAVPGSLGQPYEKPR